MSKFDRVSAKVAVAWIDGATCCLGVEPVALNQASGRVLGGDIFAAAPIPPVDCAAIDGFAVRAADTIGAGAYNPLALPSVTVVAGDALPPATDAVVPFDQAESTDRREVVVVEPLPPRANVDRLGAVAETGALLAAAGTPLLPHHIGLFGIAGFAEVPLFRRPRVRLAIAGAAHSRSFEDRNRPMIGAAIERDGGAIISELTLAEAFTGRAADIVLVLGGAGRGREDGSAAALASAGVLEIHGVALIPGDTTGFGRTGAGTPVVLLPDQPAACWWTYELFAGRALRRLGGRDPALPYREQTVTTAHKIVSSIGSTEIRPVRLRSDCRIEPIPGFVESGLRAAVEADGFVIIPEASEGYPQGVSIKAYLYRQH